MKKILIAILFIAFTLPANSQIEEIEVEEVETITSVRNYANFGAELRKTEDVYFIAYRDLTYSYSRSIEYFTVGTIDDLYEFKKLLYNVRKNNKQKVFKMAGNTFTVVPNRAKKYINIYIDEKGIYSREMGSWHMNKIDKLIPRELFSKK